MATRSLRPDPLLHPPSNDPDCRQDRLPFPYCLVDDVLNETVIYNLNLRMYEIEQKKKDSNYEGPVQEFVSQGFIELEGITCLSRGQKTHNHLLAGDRAGSVYLLDLAKRTVFSKKEISPGKKIIHIHDSIVTDGETSITTAAVVSHSHHTVTILRYRYSQPKLFATEEIVVAPDASDPNLLPYWCELYDFSRLLVVMTYGGQVLGFRVPELRLEVEKKIKAGSIPLEEDQIKKILKYPLDMAVLEGDFRKIDERVIVLNFPGVRNAPKFSDVKAKLMGVKKVAPSPAEDPKAKDPKKKDSKKPQVVEQQKKQAQLQFNPKLIPAALQQTNGNDTTANYEIPPFEPFFYIIEEQTTLPKTKYFDKAKTIPLMSHVVYGWKNTKQFYISRLQNPTLDSVPEFLQVGYSQEQLNEVKSKALKQYLSKKIELKNVKVFKNVHAITATALSLPDKTLIAFGLRDGTVSVWNPISENLQFNTEKHTGAVTQLQFFEKWKLISGDANNQVFIHNVYARQTEVKRTNVFEPKKPIPITTLHSNELGVFFALDADSNMRVYDLWRNDKISKLQPCSAFAMVEGRGKKWLPAHSVRNCSTVYSNRDFTVVISTNWPAFATRVEDRTPEELKKQQQIIRNPWKTSGSSLHVIRNFDLLLHLFQGLQSVYKKGYERKKVQNLFTNLQFEQLKDRTFEIPDFGKPQGEITRKNQSINTKSLFSQHRNSRKSFDTSKSKQKSLKPDKNQQVKLTNQVLHPQKFLLERRKVAKDVLLTSEGLIQYLREEHRRKQVRQSKLVTENSKNIF